MPNRILKETICTSDEIESLNNEQEVFFYRLMVVADDYGLMDARTQILKARCYPLKSIDSKRIQSLLDALDAVGLIRLYVSEGRPYLQIAKWDKHQTIRAKKPKYPVPQADDFICKQMQANVPVIQSNPIQSKSNPIPPNPPEGGGGVFEKFWCAYPKKIGKGAAEKAFAKAGVGIELILAAVNRQAATEQWQKDGGQYIPNPATWLNQRRWEDGVVEIKPQVIARQDFTGIGSTPVEPLNRQKAAEALAQIEEMRRARA